MPSRPHSNTAELHDTFHRSACGEAALVMGRESLCCPRATAPHRHTIMYGKADCTSTQANSRHPARKTPSFFVFPHTCPSLPKTTQQGKTTRWLSHLRSGTGALYMRRLHTARLHSGGRRTVDEPIVRGQQCTAHNPGHEPIYGGGERRRHSAGAACGCASTAAPGSRQGWLVDGCHQPARRQRDVAALPRRRARPRPT